MSAFTFIRNTVHAACISSCATISEEAQPSASRNVPAKPFGWGFFLPVFSSTRTGTGWKQPQHSLNQPGPCHGAVR